MELYDQNYVNEDEEGEISSFEYDHGQFYTEQVFSSREELTNWAKTTVRALGYVLVTKRTNKNAAGYVYKVVLACDRGGEYNGLGAMSNKQTWTIKCGCPFELEGSYREYDGWRVYVKDHNHNHHRAMDLEGHSYARRMSEAEKQYVQSLYALNVPPRDILINLKREFPGNMSIQKDIYNALQDIKDKAAKEIGSTPMQVMLSMLQKQNYICEYTVDDSSNRMENLFFVHPQSFEIWRAFPQLLIIDATYKTNIYNMPFVEIVGVTSTSKTFLVACAFVINEQGETYKWVLGCLNRLLGCRKVSAILTDRERALMNACRDVLPDAGRLLCRFHIRQNINKHCEPSFRSQKSWSQFIKKWNTLINSPTQNQYAENEIELQKHLANKQGVYNYLHQNWLSEFKHMFVSCWVDEYRHFGNYTTNRVESEHSLLKTHLQSKSTFHKLLAAIDDIVTSQVTAIKHSFEWSRINLKHEHNRPFYRLLHGRVSEHALELIAAELKRLASIEDDLSLCGHSLMKSCGIPCACQLSVYLKSGRCIPLDSITDYWRKLDFSPSTDVQEDNVSVEEDDDVLIDNEIEKLKEMAHKQSKPTKMSWLRKIKDMINPEKTDIKPPKVQNQTRGRPKKKSGNILPDLNKAPTFKEPQTLEKSRSMHTYGVEHPSQISHIGEPSRKVSESARHSSYVPKAQPPPFIDSGHESARYSPFVDLGHDSDALSQWIINSQSLRDIPSPPRRRDSDILSQWIIESQSILDVPSPPRHSPYVPTQPTVKRPFFDEIPEVFHPYITRIVNVEADGNCGFRALAVAMGLDEEGGFEWVRREMLAEYNSAKGFYDVSFSSKDNIYRNLSVSQRPRGVDYWMQIPEAGVLIANRFGCIVVCISMKGSTTVFPFWRSPEECEPHRTFSIALVWKESHYVMVELSTNCPLPYITPYWQKRNQVAAGWEVMYQHRLEHYRRLTYRPPQYVSIDSSQSSHY